MPNTVRDNPPLSRFELDDDGYTAVAYYRQAPGVITITHTEVPEAAGGRGLGSRLAAGSLELVRARGLKVVPECPFIAAYIRKHSEFNDLLL